jgi:PTH1 family peptidyl-tRNA hydrolase
MAWLVVGLGNPGRQYAHTRHNVGWQVFAPLAAAWGGAFDAAAWQKKGDAEVIETRLGNNKVVLAKPLTFMNLSGNAVAPLAKRHGIAPDHVIVVQDDKDMAVGRLRLRLGGSAGGHNGVNSIIERLGTPKFLRVKIGVGSPATGEDTADFILATFRPEEKPIIKDAVARAAAAVTSIIEAGLTPAMDRFNGATEKK